MYIDFISTFTLKNVCVSRSYTKYGKLLTAIFLDWVPISLII